MSENQHKKLRGVSPAGALKTTHPQADKLRDRLQTLEAHVENMSAENFDVEIFREYTDLLQKTQTLVQNFDPIQAEKVFFEKHAKLIDSSDHQDNTDATILKPRRKCVWKRTLLIAACVAVLLATFSMTAVGSNIFERIAEWTDETFRFSINQTAQPIITSGYVSGAVQQEEALGSSEQDRIIITENNTIDLTQYASLQEALRADGIETSLIPVYIPDGFELSTIKKVDTGNIVRYMARYIKDRNKTILLSFDVYHALSDGGGMQKDEREVECYNANGVDFYIMSNLKRMSAIAFVGSTEVSISGDISVDEIKQMIDSTHEGD